MQAKLLWKPHRVRSGCCPIPIRGGCTLIFDLDTLKLKYAIAKPLLDLNTAPGQPRQLDAARIAKQAAYQNDGDLMAASEYSKVSAWTVSPTNHSPFSTTIDPTMSNITHTEIRMYRMGTGDCFALKCFAGAALKYKMLIDCGTWSGSTTHLTPYIKNLKAYIGNRVDLLVVTHEHKDHVHVFDACENLFTQDFTADKVWMGWTEKDSATKVKQWQKDYGQQKLALFHAARKLKAAVKDPAYAAQLRHEANGSAILKSRRNFAATLEALTDLQVNTGGGAFGAYAGLLAGMEVVKKKLGPGKIAYFNPGDIIANLPQLPGIKFFVLGPRCPGRT